MKKIPGSSSIFTTFKFIRNPLHFAKDMKNKYGDLYWFRLDGKKIYVTSNNYLIELLKITKSEFFAPDEIIKSLGSNSLILRTNDHLLLKKKFVLANKNLDRSLIDEIISINTKKYFKFRNGKKLIDEMVLDILCGLCANTQYRTPLRFHFEKCMKNLTAPVMFLPFLKINFPLTKWRNFLNSKFEIIDEINKLKYCNNSFPYLLLNEDCNNAEVIDNTFLFLFAGFDTSSITVANLFTSIIPPTNFKDVINNHPPTPFLVKTINESIEYGDIIFTANTHFAIDLIHWENWQNQTPDKGFGFDKMRCPGKDLSLVIMKKVLDFLNEYFIFYDYDSIKYKRCRFSYGISSFKIEKR